MCQYQDQKRHVLPAHILLHVNVLYMKFLLLRLGLKNHPKLNIWTNVPELKMITIPHLPTRLEQGV